MELNLEPIFLNAFPLEPVPATFFWPAVVELQDEFKEGLLSRFYNKRWTSVKMNDWINTASIPVISSYLDPTAFHYYLPSLLLSTLSNRSYVAWGLEALLPRNQRRLPKGIWWEKYFLLFTSQQKASINAYFEVLSEFLQTMTEEESMLRTAKKIWAN